MTRVLAVLISLLTAVWPLLLPQPVTANPCANNVQGNQLYADAGHYVSVYGDNKQYNDQYADGGDGRYGGSGGSGGNATSGNADSSNGTNIAAAIGVSVPISVAANTAGNNANASGHNNGGDAYSTGGWGGYGGDGGYGGRGGYARAANVNEANGTGLYGTGVALDLFSHDTATANANGGDGGDGGYGGSANAGSAWGGDADGSRDATVDNWQDADSSAKAYTDTYAKAVQVSVAKSGDATAGNGGNGGNGGNAGNGGTNRYTAGAQTGHNVSVSPATATAGTLTVSGDPCSQVFEGDVIGAQILNGLNTVQNSVMQNVNASIGNAAAGAINLGTGALNNLPRENSDFGLAQGHGYGININLNPNNNQNTNVISIGQ